MWPDEVNMTKKTWYIIAPFILAALIFVDQITKYLARRDLADESFDVIKGVFSLSLVSNKGAAWGMLQGRVDILSIVSILLVIALAYFFFKVPEGKKYHIIRVLCISVVAGAIGNLIDRIGFGYVTDFLYFKLIDFPVFNVADCYITVAMFLFIILMIFYYKDEDLEFLSFTKKKTDETTGSDDSDNNDKSID